jgi:tetratricopeptide (TPR) repeat protein
MNSLLLALVLAFGAGSAQPTPMEEAEVLFREGTVQYESTDYTGAIESFTKALGIVTAERGGDEIRLTLLYNIALAHEKQFKIDKDVAHLRQALELYKRYRDFAQSKGDLGEELDVEYQIAHLEKQLQIHNQIERNKERGEQPATADPPPVSELDAGLEWKKPRNTGIGLVAGGGVLTIGGVVLAVVGSTFEGSAEDEVAKLADQGIPMDHPAWAEGDEFIASEKRRGNVFMGVGASVAVVGAVGVGVGSYYLVKSKRLREGRVSALPALSPGYAGVQISGRF